jgi:hypothetical protein
MQQLLFCYIIIICAVSIKLRVYRIIIKGPVHVYINKTSIFYNNIAQRRRTMIIIIITIMFHRDIITGWAAGDEK